MAESTSRRANSRFGKNAADTAIAVVKRMYCHKPEMSHGRIIRLINANTHLIKGRITA